PLLNSRKSTAKSYWAVRLLAAERPQGLGMAYQGHAVHSFFALLEATMIASRSLAILVVILCACCGCNEHAGSPATRKKEWPLSIVNTMPAEIKVLSSTTFRCGGVPCRLLGVKEADNPT